MCTAMQTRESATAQLFAQDVTLEQQSLVYVKRLTAVAISNILYLRNVFGEECYGHRKLDNIKLRILSERSTNAESSRIVSWLKGCFDAMEKKYLKQLTLGVFADPNHSDQLVEAYTFRFTYSSDSTTNVNLSFNERSVSERKISFNYQELHRSTYNLLKSVISLTQTLDKLPDECYLTMKLLYYEDVTPADYEPPGFVAADTDVITVKGRPISINAGEVVTPHHTIRLKIRTDNSQFANFVPTQESIFSFDSPTGRHSNRQNEFTPKKMVGHRHSKMMCSPDESVRKHDSDGHPMSSAHSRSDILTRSLKESERASIGKRVQSSAEKKSEASENAVTAKISALSVSDDENNSRRGSTSKRKVTTGEPMDLEVSESQDSAFDSIGGAKHDKKFKASKTETNITVGQRKILFQ